MLTTPIRLVTRASAGARASSAAPVSEVWAVLAHPQRWGEFEPFLRSVAPAFGSAAGDPADDVEAGQHLLARLRLMSIEVPVEIDHVVDRCSVAVTARLFPGLAEEVEHLVIPLASGGSLVTVRLTLHGPLALPALLPRWMMRTLTVRLLARAAEEGLRIAAVKSSRLPDRAEYRAIWSGLHGGYDPAESPLVNAWLSAVETMARPLAQRGVSPDVLTAAGFGAAALAVPAAIAGRRWLLLGSAAVLGSGLADSLDGAVAALSDAATPWGYVLDSLADRGADAAYLVALRRSGAPSLLVTVAAGGIATLEYARARAGNAGFGEIGLVTIGERPTRILVTAAGFAVAGLLPGRAPAVAAVTAGAVGLLSAVGAGQFLRVAARALSGPSRRADDLGDRTR